MEDSIIWRTIQFFIGEEGVNEVQVDDADPTVLRCSCVVFTKTARCKHVKWIRQKTREAGGHFNIKIPSDIPNEVAEAAMKDPTEFRKFLLKYGRPEEVL